MTPFLAAKVLLVAAFGVAAMAKLADHRGTRSMIIDFGLSPNLAVPLAWSLIGVELSVAVGLVVPPAARVASGCAAVVLAGFCAVVVVNLAQGRRPSCRCFGRLHVAEVCWSTVARNVALMVVGGFVAAGGHLVLLFALFAVVAAGAWLGLQLQDHLKFQPGAPAPALSLADQDGEARTLGSLLTAGSPLVLVFTDPRCGACRELLPEVARWQARHAGRLTIALVSGGASRERLTTTCEHGVGTVLADTDRRVAAAYGIRATPSAVLVGTDGRIAAPPAAGADEIAGLVGRATVQESGETLGRRAFLSRAALGVAAVTVLPVIAAACGAAASVGSVVRPKRLEIDNAWLCDQKYALCTSAACVPSTTDPNVSICTCKVTSGYSVGFKNCDQRAPSGTQLHSNFSLQDVTGDTRVMTCAVEGLWVQCLDVVCEIDADHPDRALCQCVNMHTTNFLTFGGNCDTSTCSSVIWSATTAPFPGGAQYEKGLKQLGVAYQVPKGCPTRNKSS
jgi:peroxiredoxin